MMDNNNIDKLIEKYGTNIKELEELVRKLIQLTDNVDLLLPREYNFRTRFVLEDRIKTITTLYDTILKYKSEISKELEKLIGMEKEFNSDVDDINLAVSKLPPEKVYELLERLTIESCENKKKS